MHGTEEAVDGEGVVAEIAPKSRSDRKIDRLGTESTFKLLLEFSIPAVAGMLVQMLYNVIDAVYVGHAVGADGLAATTVANPMMTAMVAVAMLVGVGGNALAAIKLGERKKGVAERVMGNSFVLLLIATAALWGIAIFALEPILRYSGADGSVLPLALDFMTVIVAGCPLQFIAFGMNNFIRTVGHPNRALGSMLVGTGANVVLGYLFIIVLDGGMRGAGLATVCSWALSALFVMQFFLKKGSPMPLRRPSLSLDPRIALRVCALGIAPCVTQLGFAVSSMIENNLLVLYGAGHGHRHGGATYRGLQLRRSRLRPHEARARAGHSAGHRHHDAFVGNGRPRTRPVRALVRLARDIYEGNGLGACAVPHVHSHPAYSDHRLELLRRHRPGGESDRAHAHAPDPVPYSAARVLPARSAADAAHHGA